MITYTLNLSLNFFSLYLFEYLLNFFIITAMGGCLIGARIGIIDTSLHLLLQVPLYIPEQKKFELGVLVS